MVTLVIAETIVHVLFCLFLTLALFLGRQKEHLLTKNLLPEVLTQPILVLTRVIAF